MSEIEAINQFDESSRINWHREVEADIAETVPEQMTDAELVAVIINDPDIATRRRALHVMRMREFTNGIHAGADIATKVLA